MTFTETKLPGMFVITTDLYPDNRGSFEVPWQRAALERHGLEPDLAQASLASNRKRGTIRGLHFQVAPFEEVKIVRAIRGVVWDVAVDLRPDSPTFRQWCAVELSAENRTEVYLPQGVAHGYQTLADDSDVLYFVSAPYRLDAQRGIRWDDLAFGITWPLGRPAVLSARDATFPDFAA